MADEDIKCSNYLRGHGKNFALRFVTDASISSCYADLRPLNLATADWTD